MSKHFDRFVATGQIWDVPSRKKSKASYRCQDCKQEHRASVANLITVTERSENLLCNACSKRRTYRSKWLDKVSGHICGDAPEKQGDLATFFCSTCRATLTIKVVNWLRSYKKDGRVRCASCVNDDPERRKKLSRVASTRPRRPHTGVTKERMSASALERWSDNDRAKKNVSKHIKNYHSDPEWKTFWYEKHISADEVRVKSREPGKAAAARKQSKTMRAKWKNPQFRKKMITAHASYLRTRTPSELEMLVSRTLDYLGIGYIREYVAGYYAVDIYVPDQKIFIEIQGLRWHHPELTIKPDTIRLDNSKKSYLVNNYPDHTYIDLWEDVIYTGHSLASPFVYAREDFSFKDVRFDFTTSRKVTNDFLTMFHYLEKGRLASKRLAAYVGNDLAAVIEHSLPVRKEVATSMGFTSAQVREISRFCINPRFQKKNFASFLLGKSLNLIKDQYPDLAAVVSFADTTLGHSGAIYRAANFQFLHKTQPDYSYIKDGNIMHKRTFYSMARRLKLTESQAAKVLKYDKVWGDSKLKFAYFF